ncbi:hypothetical protein J4558_13340 [Leptolyngbya sp. 15MV]|nr:hypothetical protein J4558_13340 [Leptolyngbya sp. 15MV]
MPAVIADTGGLRATSDEIEIEGVRRARRRAEDVDIVVAVFAADAAPDAETLRMVELRPDAIVVRSKQDVAGSRVGSAVGASIETSIVLGTGLDRLRKALEDRASAQAGLTAAPMVTRARHRAALLDCLNRLHEAALCQRPELVAENYRGAVRALEALTGRGGIEQILDAVFADFCIGK